MEEGLSFEESLAKAQQIGVAETDPSNDIEGWDAAVKVAALIRVLMGVPIRLEEIQREGIGKLSGEAVRAARADGRPYKLVCRAQRTDQRRDGERPAGAGTVERSAGLGRGNIVDRVF